MLNQRYAEASVEVLDILDHMDANDLEKVSKKFIKFLKENASKEYIVDLDYSKKVNDMDIKEETRGLLALMYMKFWCPEEKKEDLKKKFYENEKKYQEELIEKYNPDNLFKKTNIINEEESKFKNSDKMLIVVKKDNIFKRIIDKIKRIFSK